MSQPNNQPNLPTECPACGCTEYTPFLRVFLPDYKEHFFECGANYVTEYGRKAELLCPCEHAHEIASKLRKEPTYLKVREGSVARTVERPAVVDYDDCGRIIGVELLTKG